MAALPPSRRASTDFGRPVFTAVAFYLCAKRHKVLAESIVMFYLHFCSCINDLPLVVLKLSPFFLQLKVDKLKLIDLCGTSSSEFTTVIDLNPLIFACALFVPASHLCMRAWKECVRN